MSVRRVAKELELEPGYSRFLTTSPSGALPGRFLPRSVATNAASFRSSIGWSWSSHAGIPDTSEMLYLGGDVWVRKELIKTALGDPVRERGAPRDSTARRVNNGITGDARRSSVALGKRAFDTKVEYAVRQIRELTGTK